MLLFLINKKINTFLKLNYYFSLAGYAPFYHRRQMLMLRLIQEGKYEFRPEQWAQITQEAKDLVIFILLQKAFISILLNLKINRFEV